MRLVGFIDNPPLSRGVAGDGLGLYAVFAVTNVGPDYVRFATAAVERNSGGGWKAYTPLLHNWPTNQWVGMRGQMWAPGNGSLYAIPWPGTPTNDLWRLQMSVAKEPTRRKRAINEIVGEKLFGPGDPIRVQGPEVSLTTFRITSFP